MQSLRLIMFVVIAAAAGCGGGGSTGAVPPITGGGTPPTMMPSSTPSASPAATATPSPPAAMASVYALEAADITNFANAVAAQCPLNPTAATRFDVELLQANGNYLVTALPGKSVAQAQAMAGNAVAFAVAARRALPGIGFMINPVYPVMVQNQANAPSWWSTSANYPLFVAYYTALAQGLAQNGIPYDAEVNLVFPSYGGQGYGGMTVAQLEAGGAEDANNVLAIMTPQFLNVASEPLTLSQNTGQPSLNTPSGYGSYAAAMRAGITVPPGSPTKVGAGSADWSSTAFLTAVEGVPNLGFYDEHLYPPDFLTRPGGGIAQVNAINPSVTGKPGVITENWDEKDAGNLGSYGVGSAPLLEQLNTYSFWAPLDAQYITAMMRLARCENLSMVSFWYENELFAYLDYATASTMTPTAAQNAEAMVATQAASAGTLSPSGQAFYTGLTGLTPASRARRR